MSNPTGAETARTSEKPAPEISAADLIRSSVSFLASCVTAHGGWSDAVAQAIKNAELGIAELEGGPK